MVECGVSEPTLKWAKMKNAKCWTFTKDPDDKRAVLIKYEDLKQKYKNKVLLRFVNPYTYTAQKSIKQHLNTDYNARLYYLEYKLDTTNEGLPKESIEMYSKCAELLNLLVAITAKNGRKKLKTIAPDKKTFWDMVCSYIENENLDLPKSYKRILEKVNAYILPTENSVPNYACLIKEAKYGNTNAEKINEAAAEWLVAQYCLPTKIGIEYLHQLYNDEAAQQGWKVLKSSTTVYAYLMKPEVQQQWYGARHGYLEAKEKFGYTLRTKLPEVRNALWYADGTKLNYFDAQGKLKASYTVYKVMDVFSEMILGWHIDLSENGITQYHAFKNAIQFSSEKPYEIRYDNQGGHKKIKPFLDKLSHLGFPTQPYNGKSKTIESLIGRFQTQVMRRDWFFTGQNITAKKLNSKVNREFILENLKFLPTIQELTKILEQRVNEWNNSTHFKYKKSRLELYLNSHNPKATKVNYLDMVELFWLTNYGKKGNGITYYTHGITLTLNTVDYEYEVLKNGMPDDAFRRKYIDAELVVKYDTSDLSHIRLYKNSENGLQFITIAEPRIVNPRATQDYQEGDRERITALLNYRKSEIATMKSNDRKREARTGVSRIALINPTLGQVYKAESYTDDEENIHNDWLSQL